MITFFFFLWRKRFHEEFCKRVRSHEFYFKSLLGYEAKSGGIHISVKFRVKKGKHKMCTRVNIY